MQSKIEKETAGESGRYLGRIDGVDGQAELDFTIRGPKLISADHTEAPMSMRGTGAAMALVEYHDRRRARRRVQGRSDLSLCARAIPKASRMGGRDGGRAFGQIGTAAKRSRDSGGSRTPKPGQAASDET